MNLFGTRRPRGFHHVPIYYDERSDRINGIKERAKGQAAGTPDRTDRDRLRDGSVRAADHLYRYGSDFFPVSRMSSGIGTIVVLLAALVALWCLLNG